jgi:hypothetical protein
MAIVIQVLRIATSNGEQAARVFSRKAAQEFYEWRRLNNELKTVT